MDAISSSFDELKHEGAYRDAGVLYEPLIEQLRDWPINQFSKERARWVRLVADSARQRLLYPAGQARPAAHRLIADTMYQERIRMVQTPWKVDPPDEKDFWGGIRRGLVQAEQPGADAEALHADLIGRISTRYAEEIAGNFVPSAYHFAKRMVAFFFASLLNYGGVGNLHSLRSAIDHRVQLQDRIRLTGEIAQLRALAQRGTIVLLPTHFSNVDSILVGWAIHALGLPAFLYGAGLNLFNMPAFAYFMSRLGAYKVDRRKKNDIYLETLKAYSTEALRYGCHSLFFPGGTRSRSGHVEKRLKLGLLGTAIEAQRLHCLNPRSDGQIQRVYIVPLVIGYHFVLEAKSLIRQHLRQMGKEQFFHSEDESSNVFRFLQFIWQFASIKSEISLSFGRAIDVFGNLVDDKGESLAGGRPVDIRDYYTSQGRITADPQRDGEYARILGERVAERYKVENQVFSSHIVSFVAFEWFRAQHPALDLYSLLRLQEEDRRIPMPAFAQAVERVLAAVREMAAAGRLRTADHLVGDTMSVIEHGIANLGVYHQRRPLRFADGSHVVAESLSLLYYYHNRLDAYGLEKFMR